jgi:hypothetical protein
VQRLDPWPGIVRTSDHAVFKDLGSHGSGGPVVLIIFISCGGPCRTYDLYQKSRMALTLCSRRSGRVIFYCLCLILGRGFFSLEVRPGSDVGGVIYCARHEVKQAGPVLVRLGPLPCAPSSLIPSPKGGSPSVVLYPRFLCVAKGYSLIQFKAVMK